MHSKRIFYITDQKDCITLNWYAPILLFLYRHNDVSEKTSKEFANVIVKPATGGNTVWPGHFKVIGQYLGTSDRMKLADWATRYSAWDVNSRRYKSLILYFSATGNSKYVAERIAGDCNERICSLVDCSSGITLQPNEMLGIVTPVNLWELPVITRDFLSRLTLKTGGNNFVFIVITYGTTPGCCAEDARRVLEKQNITLDASFGVQMPDNWTPIFNLSDPEKVAIKNKKAEQQIECAIMDIRARKAGNHTHRRAPYFVRYFADPFLSRVRMTKNFYVESTCIGCGLCANKCPVQAIEIRNNRPVWVKERCAMCLGCLHRCPKFAIQYGSGKTKLHGQYQNPNTTL